jgi:hypothetical protein
MIIDRRGSAWMPKKRRRTLIRQVPRSIDAVMNQLISKRPIVADLGACDDRSSAPIFVCFRSAP